MLTRGMTAEFLSVTFIFSLSLSLFLWKPISTLRDILKVSREEVRSSWILSELLNESRESFKRQFWNLVDIEMLFKRKLYRWKMIYQLFFFFLNLILRIKQIDMYQNVWSSRCISIVTFNPFLLYQFSLYIERINLRYFIQFYFKDTSWNGWI